MHYMIKTYDKAIEIQMLRHYQILPERLRRHYAGLEALKLDYGGKGYICQLFNLSYNTLLKGIKEVQFPELYAAPHNGKQRKGGGGRKKICP